MEIIDIKNGMYICDKGSFPVSQQNEYELVSKKIDTKLNDYSVSNELREASFAHARKEIKNPTCPNNEEFELVYTFEEGAKWNAAQKSAWSEKHIADVFEKVGLAKIVREQSNDALIIALQDAMTELSKVTLQPKPTAWSEENEDNMLMIEDRLRDFLDYIKKDSTLKKHIKNSLKEEIIENIDWLKSLRPQNAWKPSEEQLDALEYHLKHTNENSRLYKETKNLYDQLKRL
jgi:hypothetical protein